MLLRDIYLGSRASNLFVATVKADRSGARPDHRRIMASRLVSFLANRTLGARNDSEETLVWGEAAVAADAEVITIDVEGDGGSRSVSWTVVDPDTAPQTGIAASSSSGLSIGDGATPPPTPPPIVTSERLAKKPKLSCKEKAACGAVKIGHWTRQRIICPHHPNGIVDIWVPEFGGMGASLKRSLSETLQLFQKGQHEVSSFYMFLVVDFFFNLGSICF